MDKKVMKIYYDGDCGFCQRSLIFIRRAFRIEPIPMLAAQGDPDIFKDMERMNSWIVIDDAGGRHYRFQAFTLLCAASPVFRFLAPFFRLRAVSFVGERVYKLVAKNRGRGRASCGTDR